MIEKQHIVPLNGKGVKCMKLTILASCVFWSATLMAAPGDTLYTQGDAINIRLLPSVDSEVVLQLNKGHKLIEIEVKEDWVEVFPALSGGKSGWVHSSLVSPVFNGGKTVAPVSEKFAKFKKAFDELNGKIINLTGIALFTDAVDLGDGVIQITASTEWLAADKDLQRSTLKTVHNLWAAADGTGLPIAIYVIDDNGHTRFKYGGK